MSVIYLGNNEAVQWIQGQIKEVYDYAWFLGYILVISLKENLLTRLK